jgi:transposase
MKTRKQYTKEFKEDAIWLVWEHGCKQTEAARRLGVDRRMLARWIKASQCEAVRRFRATASSTRSSSSGVACARRLDASAWSVKS